MPPHKLLPYQTDIFIFELTDLVMDWLNQEYPGKFKHIEPKNLNSYYEVIIREGQASVFQQIIDGGPMPWRRSLYDAFYVGRDRIWLYEMNSHTIAFAGDPSFFDQINNHIEKNWL